MKQILKSVLVPLALAALAGCATAPKSYELPVNADGKYADPNVFAGYGPAMENTKDNPLGSYWQQQNRDRLAAATKTELIADFCSTPAKADGLLAKVGPAYTTDPVILTQIGAVTSLVMTPKCDKAPAARKIWVAALERALDGAPDEYRKAFFRDQLRWCAYKPVVNK